MVLDKFVKEADEDTWYDTLDKQLFALHYSLAEDKQKEYLLVWYRFQLAFQEKFHTFLTIQNDIHEKIVEIQQHGSLSGGEVSSFAMAFHGSRSQFDSLMDKMDELTLPEMSNTEHVVSLKQFLLLDKVLYISTSGLNGNQINGVMQQLQSIIDKSRRIYFKGLGDILKLKERIWEEVEA